MVKGVLIYNLWCNLKLVLECCNLVLCLLQQQKIIDQEFYDMLSVCLFGVQLCGGVILLQLVFMQMVCQELQVKLGDKIKDFFGVKIFIIFDFVVQDVVEKVVVEGILVLKKQCKLSDLEIVMVVVDCFSGEVCVMVGGVELQYVGYNCVMQVCCFIGLLVKLVIYLIVLSQLNLYCLNIWIVDVLIFLCQLNGQVWLLQNDDCCYSESGKVMLVDVLICLMNVLMVNLGMVLGLLVVIDIWMKFGVLKDQFNLVLVMLLGVLNLMLIEVVQVFQIIVSGGNCVLLLVLCLVIEEDGKVLY